MMKRWLSLLTALVLFFIVHEGSHAVIALLFGEFDAFHIRTFGMEVTFNTPVTERSGFHWAIISGTGNLVTLLIGYSLFVYRGHFAQWKNWFWKASIYYATLLFLVLDAFNLSIGPFIYGGDANGIAVGLGVNRFIIQAIFFVVLLVNRELIAQKLLPAYNVKTNSLLLRPWVKKRSIET